MNKFWGCTPLTIKKLQELEDCHKQELGEFQADILKLQEELAKLEGELAQYDQKKEH
jgi:phage shock protein A